MRKLPPGIWIMDPRLDCPGAMTCFRSLLLAGPSLSTMFLRNAPPTSGASAFSASKGLSSRIRFWYEVEWRSGRDEFLPLFAFLEVPDDTVCMLHHPPAHIALVHGFAFLRILLEVRNAGETQRQFRVVKVLLALEVDLEVLPFDRVKFFIEPDHAVIAVRVFLFAEREGALVDAVDDPILRGLAPGEAQKRGEHIGDMKHLVAFGPRLDLARPANEEWRANAAFCRTEIRAVEESAGSASDQVVLGAVVAAHDDNCIVGNSKFIELVEQHTEVVVEHQEAIAPFSIRALSRKFVARTHREMHQRVIEIEEKRFVCCDAALHEIDTALLIFEVAGLFHFHGELLRQDRLDALAFLALVHMGEAVAFGDVVRIFEPHAFVIGAQRAVPLVEAVIRRPASVF